VWIEDERYVKGDGPSEDKDIGLDGVNTATGWRQTE